MSTQREAYLQKFIFFLAQVSTFIQQVAEENIKFSVLPKDTQVCGPTPDLFIRPSLS